MDDLVQIGAGGVALFAEQGIVVAAAEDPRARPGRAGLFAQGRDHVGDGFDLADRRAVEIHGIERHRAGLHEVVVGGVKARQHGLAGEIDDFGLRRRQGRYFPIASTERILPDLTATASAAGACGFIVTTVPWR